jgi:hypothetical protein
MFFLCSFLYLHKETNQQQSGEESAAVHSPLPCWSAFGGLLCAAHKERMLRKVVEFIPPCGVLRRIVFPHFVTLLGFVKLQ